MNPRSSARRSPPPRRDRQIDRLLARRSPHRFRSIADTLRFHPADVRCCARGRNVPERLRRPVSHSPLGSINSRPITPQGNRPECAGRRRHPMIDDGLAADDSQVPKAWSIGGATYFFMAQRAHAEHRPSGHGVGHPLPCARPAGYRGGQRRLARVVRSRSAVAAVLRAFQFETTHQNRATQAAPEASPTLSYKKPPLQGPGDGSTGWAA